MLYCISKCTQLSVIFRPNPQTNKENYSAESHAHMATPSTGMTCQEEERHYFLWKTTQKYWAQLWVHVRNAGMSAEWDHRLLKSHQIKQLNHTPSNKKQTKKQTKKNQYCINSRWEGYSSPKNPVAYRSVIERNRWNCYILYCS